MSEEVKLRVLYAAYAGEEPVSVAAMPQSGSNRRYFRIAGRDGRTAVGVIGTSVEENRAFVSIARHFRSKDLNVPEVYAVADDMTSYIQEDLGDESLFGVLSAGRKADGGYDDSVTQTLVKTMRAIADVQLRGAEGLDFSVCYPQPDFDRRTVMFDLNYFKYCFLKPSGVDFLETRLEDDFQRMADVLTEADGMKAFMYRDFQSRNVMLKGGEPYFIDFQGGRRGPVYYDVASFVWQAKAAYPEWLRDRLVREYISALRRYVAVDETVFRTRLRHFVLFRTLQVLGAYGYRGWFERKPHFVESIPFAIDNLRELIVKPFAEYPYLMEVLSALTERFAVQEKKRLTVRVYSFSYKKGVPDDESGNGGGYVFDCRALNNPGRYDEYKSLTGMDSAVVKFIEDDGGVFAFLESAYRLVDAHAAQFIGRGFTDMMVSFGCTGGQHRSVYCAERMAEHLAVKFGVDVRLIHRERGVERTIRGRR